VDAKTIPLPPVHALRPRSRPLPSRLVLASLPLIAVITLGCVFSAARWVYRVYPGFFLWQNNFVPAIDVFNGAASRAGLRFQSRLLAVDGAPVQTRQEVEAVIAARPVGTPFRYTLAKGGETYEIHLASTRLSLPVFALTLGNYLLNALVFLALGVAIVFLDPHSRGALAFFVFCANYGLYLATSIDLMGPSWFQIPYFFLVTLCPATMLHLAIDYPGVSPGLARLRRLLPPLYAACVVLGLASAVAFWPSFSTLMALDRITHLGMAAALLSALAIAVSSLRRADSTVARARLRLFLLGLGAAALIPAFVLLAVYTAGAAVPLNYLTLGFGFFPAAIAYAIVRYELFGADRMLRRTVAYVVVTFVVGLIYTAILAVVDYVVFPDLYASPAFHVLVTMLLLALFSPLRGRVQAVVDLLFFRLPYDYRATVGAASHALASILDLDALVGRLLGIITEKMQVERAAVWLRDPVRGDFRREGQPAPPIAAASPLVEHLEGSGASVHVAQRPIGGATPEGARAAMAEIGATLAVPMILEQRLVGFITLGEKGSGRMYAGEDLDLLATLASQAAVAVQNARAYRALAEANRELRETRDRLVDAERLAAVGELSAAVAHGIRNPVAGIKTAAEFGVRAIGPDHALRQSFLDILSEADALDSRISELLDFARPFVPHRAPADLNEIVRGLVHLLRRQIAERRIDVVLDLAPTLPAHELDEAQIEQVALALMTNALEAMGTGGRLTLSTALAAGGDGGGESFLELRVRDTGQGIAPDQLPKIFKLFYTRKARGTGVGLAVVRRIVDGHQGRIEVSSELGEGTEFRVLLPLHVAEPRPETSAAATR
jgi:signal transduction histidine kinase